jgi:hypothetical protein
MADDPAAVESVLIRDFDAQVRVLPVRTNWRDWSASMIALVLLFIFGITILTVLVGAAIAIQRGKSPTEASEYASVLTTVLKELGPFATSVFAPLLAFVLGYYFGEKQQTKPE